MIYSYLINLRYYKNQRYLNMGTLTPTKPLLKPIAKHSLDKKKINILLLEGIHQNAIAALNSAGYTNIKTHTKALDKDKLEDAIKNAHIIGIRSRTQLTSELLEKAQKLMAIGCFCRMRRSNTCRSSGWCCSIK